MRGSYHRPILLALVAGLGFCLCAGVTSAATFHVSPFGSNTPPYDSYAKAAHRVADAVLAASGYGDTVLVHTGTYDFDTTIYIRAGVTWAGGGRDSVVLNWSDKQYRYGVLAQVGGDNRVSGLEFNYPMGSSFNQAVQGILALASKTLEVHGCRFRQLTVSIGYGTMEADSNEFLFGQTSGLYLANGSSWLHHNSFWGTTSGEGVMCSWAGSALIENNVFNNDATGGRPSGVRIDHASWIVVRNNLMVRTSEPVSWFYASGVVENNTMIAASGLSGGSPWRTVIPAALRSYETLTVRNNIMKDCLGLFEFWPESYACCDTTELITFVHNAFWPPIDSFYTVGPTHYPWRVKIRDSSNFVAYPMFVSDSSFRLQRGSPLIDTGDPAVKDADSSRSDIGWWGGPHGSSGGYPEMPPEPPAVVWDSGSSHVAWLRWSPRPEADLAGYRVYRGGSSGFWTPGITPMRELASGMLQMADTLPAGGGATYYVLTAFDRVGLESGPSPECVFPNAPPPPPDSLWGDPIDHVVTLHWAPSPAIDLGGYRVYRGGSPGFWTPELPPLRQVTGAWVRATDTLSRDVAVAYYVVTAFDSAGLESDPSSEWAYHDRPPLSPDSVWGSGVGRIVALGWRPRHVEYIKEYNVYRGGTHGFWAPGQLPIRRLPVGVIQTADTVPGCTRRAWYVVTAVGESGLESGASPEYMYEDGSPLPPESLWGSGANHVVVLHWAPPPQLDLAGYRVYRGSSPGFWTPGLVPVRQLDSTATQSVDTLPSTDMAACYVITAFDKAGVDGCPSPEVCVAAADDALPRTPCILRTYPNPFNSSMVIEVAIPPVGASPAPVEIEIFNALGQNVGTAFKGALAPGVHQLEWNAVDTPGHPLASGVYFARLRVWSSTFGKPAKVVVVR